MEVVDEKMKRKIKKTIQFIIFILLLNLPFMTMIQITGMETFLDSFENSNYYVQLKGNGISMHPTVNDDDYIILQKASHPEFSVEKGDIILYCKDDGGTACHRVYNINSIGTLKQYHTKGNTNDFGDEPIYEYQILGKVKHIVDSNIWNAFSMKIWDISIHNLNVNALFTNN